MDFNVPADHRVKLKESEKKNKYCEGIEKTVEHECDDYTNCNWCSWYSHQKIGTGTGGLWNKRTSRGHLNYCIIEISQNTEKSARERERTNQKWYKNDRWLDYNHPVSVAVEYADSASVEELDL